MLNREQIRSFLINQKDKTKEDVLMNFTTYALANGESIDKLGKIISDLRSYSEWSWGE